MPGGTEWDSTDAGNSTGADGVGVGRWLATVLPVTPLLRWAVLVHSVPPGQPWRTGCPHCAAAARPPAGAGLLPRVLSPAARCHGCGQRAGAPPYLLEAATLAAAALVVAAAVGGGWSAPAVVGLAGWTLLAVPLGVIDAAVHRLPDRLTLPAAGWVLAATGLAALTGSGGGAWLRAVAAAGLCAVGFALVTLVLGARGFGLGDAKLALSAAALLGWLGWTALVAGLLLAFLGSGLVAAGLLATRRVGRRDTLPFGPFLVAGTLAALAWAGLSG